MTQQRKETITQATHPIPMNTPRSIEQETAHYQYPLPIPRNHHKNSNLTTRITGAARALAYSCVASITQLSCTSSENKANDELTPPTSGPLQTTDRELHAIAVYHALSTNNNELLDSVFNSGWDPLAPLGAFTGHPEIRQNAATAASILGNHQAISLIRDKNAGALDARDGNLDRPIDILLDSSSNTSFPPLSPSVIRRCIEATHSSRPRDRLDPREEVIVNIVRRSGASNIKIPIVNDLPASEEWDILSGSVSDRFMYYDFCDVKKNVYAVIRWTKKSEDAYEFSASLSDRDPSVRGESTDPSWGGVRGVVQFIHGYWISEQLEMWDN